MRNVLFIVLTLFGASLCWAADVYPSKPVRVIVAFAPGGGSDTVGRLLSQQLSEQLGTPFVVENRQGGNSTIGYGFVARSEPDGYTLLVMDTTFTALPSLFKSLPYDPIKDFIPITFTNRTPMALVVNPSVKANTLSEFIALARANPGKLNFGGAGTGSGAHLAAELFKMVAQVNVAHIPYKGGGEAMNAVVGGQIEMLLTGVSTVAAQVKSGRLRALAVTTDGKRSPVLPDVPSMNEAGISGMTVYSWQGIAARSGTPKEIVNKLHDEVNKAITVPSVRERLIGMGTEPSGSSTEEFTAFVRSEIQRWAGVIKSAGVTPE